MTPYMYKCAGCAKEGEVAFRVSIRRPDKIARANPETPKPLCLRCAEDERARLVQLAAAAEKTTVDEAKREKPSVPKPARPKAEPGLEIKLNWRWASYGGTWTKIRPVLAGHYWVWAFGDQEPVLKRVGETNSTMNAFLDNKDAWFLGPCKVPPTPLEAAKDREEAPKEPVEAPQ